MLSIVWFGGSALCWSLAKAAPEESTAGILKAAGWALLVVGCICLAFGS